MDEELRALVDNSIIRPDVDISDVRMSKVEVTRTRWMESTIRLPTSGMVTYADGKTLFRRIDFTGRQYLRAILNSNSRRTLLLAGRQVEKSCHENTEVLMRDGSTKRIKDVLLNDCVVGLAKDKTHTDVGYVSWKSQRYKKPCVRIKTRQGHEVVVALTHPMRRWGAWVPAGDLSEGDRLAVARSAGEFEEEADLSDTEIIIAAGMVAEGSCWGTPRFTQQDGPLLDLFVDACDSLGIYYTIHQNGGSWELRFVKSPDGTENYMRTLLKRWKLYDERSEEKRFPSWVWGLGQQQSAFFLNILWGGDGHASKDGSSYHLEYDSISARLIADVQRLLWKFGVPSSTRRWKPTLYKGTDKWGHKLRVETADGARIFIEHIGAIGKTETMEVPFVDPNNNRDTYPIEITKDIQQILRTRPGLSGGPYAEQPSLHSAGLRKSPKYPLTKAKLQQYTDFFRSDERFDQAAVDELVAHLGTDLYWDEVVDITDVGEQWCYDITVEGTDSFVGGGFITHNSTTLANWMLCDCCTMPGYTWLYVSPSNPQTKQFSRDRLKLVIGASPTLSGAYSPTYLDDSVYEKNFGTKSTIILRYAFLNADRARGISARGLAIDEVQDILIDAVPVLNECLAKYPDSAQRIYAGTPKSTDNTIEYYWSRESTQNEWMIPCDASGGDYRHWNCARIENIGKHHLICSKCGARIHPSHPDAQWASHYRPTADMYFHGFRIPQPITPWYNTDSGYQELLNKRNTYPQSKLHNEVLGISYDSGTKPLQKSDLQRISDWRLSMQPDIRSKIRTMLPSNQRIWAGIDYGTGEKAYTVVSIGTYIDGRFTYVHMYQLQPDEYDTEKHKEALFRILDEWKVADRGLIGVDYGGGFHVTPALIQRYGAKKVFKYQYLNTKSLIKWEKDLHRYIVNRTEVMSRFITALKESDHFAFPMWEEWEDPYAEDFCAIYSEFNESINQDVYAKVAGKTDDSFHACLYAFLVSYHQNPRPEILVYDKVA